MVIFVEKTYSPLDETNEKARQAANVECAVKGLPS